MVKVDKWIIVRLFVRRGLAVFWIHSVSHDYLGHCLDVVEWMGEYSLLWM